MKKSRVHSKKGSESKSQRSGAQGLHEVKLAKDPFLWHVNQHFSGILSKFKKIDEASVKQYMSIIAGKINEMSEAGEFDTIESMVRDAFLKRLQEHAIRKMAFLNGCATDKDKDANGFRPLKLDDPDYYSNLQQYFLYSHRIHFSHVMECFSPGLEVPSSYALTTATDMICFGDVKDTLWQNHLEIVVLDNIRTSLFQEENYPWVAEILSGKIPKYSVLLSGVSKFKNPVAQSIILKYQIGNNITQCLQKESEFLSKYIKTTSDKIQSHEKEKPGFFMALLCALCREDIRILASQYAQEIIRDRIKDISSCIDAFKLGAAWAALKGSGIVKARHELAVNIQGHLKLLRESFSDYEQQIMDRRLQFYAQRLTMMENLELMDSSPSDRNLRPFFSRAFAPNHILSIQFDSESNDYLTNPVKLIEVCGSDDGLCWLVHQYGEYELQVWEDVLEMIDFDELNLDEDIGAYILHTTFLDHMFIPSETLSGRFITKIFSRLISQIMSKTTDTAENSFSLPNITELVNKMKNSFANLLDHPQVVKLRDEFNKAYQEENWLEAQRLWPVFSKFQRLLLSTEKPREMFEKHQKYKAPSKGQDYDFTGVLDAKPENYDVLLSKAWECYQQRASNHYHRIYPSSATQLLKYSSRKKEKTATLDMSELLQELTKVGSAIEQDLAAHGELSANVITPVLCFVVSDRPHQKSGEHGRVFVPVNLELLIQDHSYLLSKDFKDGVFDIEDEEEKNHYLKHRANLDYQQGMRALGKTDPKDISTENNSLLYHSERVLLELLRIPKTAEILIDLLIKQLHAQLGGALQEGKYKVYAASLLMYSKNSICDLCTPSLIALQNSQNEGFLNNLVKAFNHESRPFKTSEAGLSLLTVVTSAKPWSDQAHDLRESTVNTPNTSKLMTNPKGLLHLPKNTLDLHDIKKNIGLKKRQPFCSIVEFVDADFSVRTHAAKQTKFFFTGNSFMSGSKKDKFGDASDEVDIKVASTMGRFG